MGILFVSVQSQAICKGKISHFPHCGSWNIIYSNYQGNFNQYPGQEEHRGKDRQWWRTVDSSVDKTWSLAHFNSFGSSFGSQLETTAWLLYNRTNVDSDCFYFPVVMGFWVNCLILFSLVLSQKSLNVFLIQYNRERYKENVEDLVSVFTESNFTITMCNIFRGNWEFTVNGKMQ